MKQPDMPWFYNWLYWAGIIWFLFWCFQIAADGVQYNAAVPYIATALGPVAALWFWKRLRTGSWI